MTIATGDDATAADVLAVQTAAASALTAAGTALANSATALSNSVAAEATAAAAAALAAVALSVPALPVVTTVASSDTLPIGQGGSTVAISLANLLAGETVDQFTAAAPAGDTDVLVTGQGSSTMLAQPLSAIWAWIAGHLPQWKRPVVEIASPTQLDASIHNSAILVCSAATTINPAFATQGSGFSCTIVNASPGAVTLGAGFVTNTGTLSIPVGQVGEVSTASYSGGSLNFVNVSAASGGSNPTPPGAPSGLTAGSATSTTITLAWTAASTGGAPSSYAVEQSPDGSTWGAPQAASGTSYIATGLSPSTAYYFRVAGVNGAGTGSYTSAVGPTSTGAAASYAPGVPTALAAGTTTTSTIPVTWTAPAVDGTHGAATSYTVQWRVMGSGGGYTQATGIAPTAYTITGLAASTQYDIQVQAVNGIGASAFTSSISPDPETAAASGNYAMGSGYQPYGAGTSFAHGTTVGSVNVSDMSATNDGSHTVPTQVYFGWSTSSSVAPSSTAGMTAAGGQFSNGGHNYWYEFGFATPSVAGTYYVWAVEVNAGGSIVASAVQANQVINGGTPVAFTIT